IQKDAAPAWAGSLVVYSFLVPEPGAAEPRPTALGFVDALLLTGFCQKYIGIRLVDEEETGIDDRRKLAHADGSAWDIIDVSVHIIVCELQGEIAFQIGCDSGCRLDLPRFDCAKYRIEDVGGDDDHFSGQTKFFYGRAQA